MVQLLKKAAFLRLAHSDDIKLLNSEREDSTAVLFYCHDDLLRFKTSTYVYTSGTSTRFKTTLNHFNVDKESINILSMPSMKSLEKGQTMLTII